MTLVGDLRRGIDDRCCANSISRKDGKTKLWIDIQSEMGVHVVIDFDAEELDLSGSSACPDFLFVGDSGGATNAPGMGDPGRLAPIEISAGRSKSAGKIRRQLQAGADWADERIGRRFKPTLLPVYLGGISRIEMGNLRKESSKVRFRNTKKYIKVLSNGRKLPPPDPD